MIEGELNQRIILTIIGSKAQNDMRKYSENEMRTHLKYTPDRLEKTLPTEFLVGCQRPTRGNGYPQSLTGEKTVAFSTQLQNLTKKGFIDLNGKEQEVDVIICTTGLDTSYRPRFPLIVNGIDLR